MPTRVKAEQSSPVQRQTLNLRFRGDERGLIERAAALTGKSGSDFVRDAARKAAEDALLDRTLFQVDDETFAAVLDRLDQPAAPNERLRRTMSTVISTDPA